MTEVYIHNTILGGMSQGDRVSMESSANNEITVFVTNFSFA